MNASNRLASNDIVYVSSHRKKRLAMCNHLFVFLLSSSLFFFFFLLISIFFLFFIFLFLSLLLLDSSALTIPSKYPLDFFFFYSHLYIYTYTYQQAENRSTGPHPLIHADGTLSVYYTVNVYLEEAEPVWGSFFLNQVISDKPTWKRFTSISMCKTFLYLLQIYIYKHYF